MSGVALILAGHGSHVSPNTAGVVWRYVDGLRRGGVADEVTACFWKEAPEFSQALTTVKSTDIVIVPLFTAAGYFSAEVLPTEMGLAGSLTRRDGARIHLTPALGEHPLMESIVETRLRDAVARHGLAPSETAAAIIGHGTGRSPRSRDTARHQADRIRGLNWLNEVVDVYLDDEPAIPSLYDSTRSPHIIALPYFLAEGSHVTRDVPRALGITGQRPPERVKGRRVYYCEPVGGDDAVCAAILDLARGVDLPFEFKSGAGAWSGFPAAGGSALMKALDSGRILRFGQISVSRNRVWKGRASSQRVAISSPADLRRHVREGPFRPLPTRTDMPGSWQVRLDQPEQAWAVIETVYPGLIADWAAQKANTLRIQTLETIGLRQKGMFKDIHKLPRDLMRKAIEGVCGACIRQPTWWTDPQPAAAGLPCPAPCNFWLSTARKMGEAKP